MSPGLEVLRASYRNQKKGRQLLAPHRVYELHLDNLITSNVFRKDHRIRIQVSATFFPGISRAICSRATFENSSAGMQKANISIYTDRRRLSRIILPDRFCAGSFRQSMKAAHDDREIRRRHCPESET